MSKNRVRYYSDEKNDDFARLNIKTKPLGDNYKYEHDNIVWNTCSCVTYRFIAQPLIFVFIKIIHKQKFKNRKVIRKVKHSGAFIYANHTNSILDAAVPNLVKPSKRNYIIVNPNATSIPGIKNLVEMLGAIPIGETLSENKKMVKCINHHINDGKFVTIYPEAHIWPYYTGIRDYEAVSFGYPCYTNTPSFTITNCYQKKLVGKRPKVVSYVDGPFYPDTSLPLHERKEKLRNECHLAMERRAKECSTYSYIKYEKLEKTDGLN